MSNKRQVFISYSRQDREWLDRLNTFLRPLQREADLQVWSDTDIRPSSNWRADIQKAINEADAAILLISQDFLASDFIANDELPELLSAASERGLQIFPLFVSECFLKNSPLLKFQGINSPQSPLDTLQKPEQNRVLARLAERIDDLLRVAQVGVTEEWLDKFRDRFELVVGGTCLMGDGEIYAQQHALMEKDVQIESFRLGRFVITQSEWAAIMNTRPWLNEKNVKYGDEIPAVYVNWYDAINFIRTINRADSNFTYRLPSEQEWEYAARGGQKAPQGARTKFCFGNDKNQLIEHGWHDQNASFAGESYAHPVGLLKPNPLNLFDMHGNVWEWTADNCNGLRALRGGGFNFMAEGASSAFRVEQKPEVKGEATGFRLIQEPK